MKDYKKILLIHLLFCNFFIKSQGGIVGPQEPRRLDLDPVGIFVPVAIAFKKITLIPAIAQEQLENIFMQGLSRDSETDFLYDFIKPSPYVLRIFYPDGIIKRRFLSGAAYKRGAQLVEFDNQGSSVIFTDYATKKVKMVKISLIEPQAIIERILLSKGFQTVKTELTVRR